MFAQLTKYLIHYKSVSIPEIGSFKLLREPSRHDVAEKIIYPPLYSIQYDTSQEVRRHQLYYIAAASGAEVNTVDDQLHTLGKQFRAELQRNSFSWNRIGLFAEKSTNAISFQPNEIVIEGLQPIAAHKVIRENVQHAVLIGEQEMMKGGMPDEIVAPEKRKKYVVLIGWILVIMAVAFIVFYLYKEGFQSLSSGTKMKAVPSSVSK